MLAPPFAGEAWDMAITANTACDYIFAKKRMTGGQSQGELSISIRGFADFLICASQKSDGALAITGSLPSVVDVDPLSYRFADGTLFLMNPDGEEVPEEVIQSVEREVERQHKGLAEAMAKAFDQAFASVPTGDAEATDGEPTVEPMGEVVDESVERETSNGGEASITAGLTGASDMGFLREDTEESGRISQNPAGTDAGPDAPASAYAIEEGADATGMPSLPNILDGDWEPIALRARRTGRGSEIVDPTRKELGLLRSLRILISMLDRNGEVDTVPISVIDDAGGHHEAYASEIYLLPGALMMRYEDSDRISATIRTVSVPFESISSISISEPKGTPAGEPMA